MSIELWLSAVDKERFERICNGKELQEERVRLSSYLESDISAGRILTGELTGNNIGKLSALRKEFVLGRIDKKDEVMLLNNSFYGKNGNVLTQQKYNGGALLLGGLGCELVKSVFLTYYDVSVKKRNEKDHHFILYQSKKQDSMWKREICLKD